MDKKERLIKYSTFGKDFQLIIQIYKKSFLNLCSNKKKREDIMFNVLLQLNEDRINNVQNINNSSESEIKIKIYNMLDEEIKNLRKGKGE